MARPTNTLTRPDQLHIHPTASNQTTSSQITTQQSASLATVNRWNDMPHELVYQVMYWMMINENSTTAHNGLATTSKSFHQLGKAFQSNSMYKNAQSNIVHTNLVNNCFRYLDSLGYRGVYLASKNTNELVEVFRTLDEKEFKTERDVFLDLTKTSNSSFCAPEVQQVISTYQNDGLSVRLNLNANNTSLIPQITQSLPKHVSLNLSINVTADAAAFANLIRSTCNGKHMSSVYLIDYENKLDTMPEARQALLEALCDKGLISYVHIESIYSKNLLPDLTEKFQVLRNVPLLSIYSENTATAIEAFVKAVEQRHASGKTRVTVALLITNEEVKKSLPSIFLSPEELQRLEGLGLFFGVIAQSAENSIFMSKIRKSVKEGPVSDFECVANWSLPQVELASEGNDSKDSDVIAEGSNEDAANDSLDNDFTNHHEDNPVLISPPREDRNARRTPNSSSTPKVVKRKKDRCIVS